MNTEVNRSFGIKILRPHWTQFCITQFPAMLVCTLMFVAATADWFSIGEGFLIVAIFILTYLICQGTYLARVQYIVTEEQIIYLHGILYHETDFMELYRVVDYQEKRTFMQQLAGLKSVVIYSMDRNTPVLNILGIKANYDLIRFIRERVEYNKARKGIYEITNRM